MGGLAVRRKKRRRALRRNPVEQLKQMERTLLALCALGGAIALCAGLLRGEGAARLVGPLLCLGAVASPAGLRAVCALLLRRMGQPGGLYAAVTRMQRTACVRTIRLNDLSEITDGRFEAEAVGAPFAQEDERALRRQSAWMLLCTACALCSSGPHAQYARAHGYDADKLQRQFPVRALHTDEEDVTEGCFRDGSGERAFCSGPMQRVIERCALLWAEVPRPLTQAEREVLQGVARDALRRGLRVEAYAMRSADTWAFLGYVALSPVPRPGAAERVQALRLRGVRTMLPADADAQARLLARKVGVACGPGRPVARKPVEGTADLGGAQALFSREHGLEGALAAIETARGRLARLVEAARSAESAAILLNVVCTSARLAGYPAWPFVPAAAAIYACVYLYYARQIR